METSACVIVEWDGLIVYCRLECLLSRCSMKQLDCTLYAGMSAIELLDFVTGRQIFFFKSENQ